MALPTMVVSLVLAVPIVVLSAHVATLLLARARRDEVPALALLALFWGGIALYTAVEAIWGLKVLLGLPGLTLGQVVLQLKLLGSVAAFAGLVSYMVCVYTGRRAWLVPVALGYVALYGYAVLYYARRLPIGEHAGVWGARLDYLNPGGGPAWTVLVLAWFVPPILASLAYASLYRHLAAREQRYRLVMVSGGFVLFFAPAILGWLHGGWYWWGLVEKVLALTSTIVFYAAFCPPAFARQLFGARAYLEERGADGRAWSEPARP